MRSMDQAALPILKRISRRQDMKILGEEIEILRRWAFKTMLVRSILDEASGLRAPEPWFRKFHAGDGALPRQVLQFAALSTKRDAIASNTRSEVHVTDWELLTVHESLILLDTLVIVTVVWDGSGESSDWCREVVETYMNLYGDSVVALNGSATLAFGQPYPYEYLNLLRNPIRMEPDVPFEEQVEIPMRRESKAELLRRWADADDTTPR
ncbi:hypothetical protein FQ142_08295 [Microbacterium sp. ANT_H45B]|uniref:hypothetical protein n=1 Tax=Microbacterium sp. ANT_H45B TaxID=2597346 RepID=UPI0011F068CC|nr:hypothetical protein [Microbacterium sp. ANT_H45B]KAA0960871.1 hypothetical protein FQ142_08295 [Microbacterium sp. ANT_H45B]